MRYLFAWHGWRCWQAMGEAVKGKGVHPADKTCTSIQVIHLRVGAGPLCVVSGSEDGSMRRLLCSWRRRGQMALEGGVLLGEHAAGTAVKTLCLVPLPQPCPSNVSGECLLLHPHLRQLVCARCSSGKDAFYCLKTSLAGCAGFHLLQIGGLN